MKTKIYAAVALGLGFMMFGNNAKAQIQDEQNVTVTMDLQPVLQLNMTTPDEVDFTFDNIGSYMGGEIKYGATTLTVSSTVGWQLYAAGISQGSVAAGDWDNPVNYGLAPAGAEVNTIPLDALELHQYPANSEAVGFGLSGGCGTPDYSLQFQGLLANTGTGIGGQNTIFCPITPYAPPTATDKMIAGGLPGGPGDGMVGGSYLSTANQVVATSGFFYVIDYRIVPGLPVVFPLAESDDCITANPIAAGDYAAPGYYTMDVKYLLIQAQ